jgi:hypothetical protein
LVIKLLIVDQVEKDLQERKIQRRHPVLTRQHPPQVPQRRLKVQEEVTILVSRAHAIIVSRLVTNKTNVSTISDTSVML